MKATRQSYLAFENAVREIKKRLINEQMAYLKDVVAKYGNKIHLFDELTNECCITFFNNNDDEYQVKPVSSIILNNGDLYLGFDYSNDYAHQLRYDWDLSLEDWQSLCDIVCEYDETMSDEEED